MQEILRLQNIQNKELQAAVLLALHCAPILWGLKAANSVTVTKEEKEAVCGLLRETEISHCFFPLREQWGILYLYRPKELEGYIYQPDIRAFLREQGYVEEEMEDMLYRLSWRIRLYGMGKAAFPHEIGVFLEYPLEDVKGFMVHQGAEAACSGYWKVYAPAPEKAERFLAYDKAKELLLKEVLNGKNIEEMLI